MLVTFLHVSAATLAQKVSLHKTNVTFNEVLEEIRHQTGYDFVYSDEILKDSRKVTVNVKNEDLKVVLDQIFTNQPLEYEVGDKIVIVSKKTPSIWQQIKDKFDEISVKGRVLDEQGNPIAKAVIKLPGTNRSTITDDNGYFFLDKVGQYNTIEVSFIGFITESLPAKKDMGTIVLKVQIKALEQVLINAGYYSTTEKERTGSISTVTAKDISTQPVDNVFQALAGKVPGLTVMQTDGLPGGNFDVTIRGKNSLQEGYHPLIIIDGVPFFNDKTSGSFPGAGLSNSPLGVLNPNDIESVEVLKDADATTIYGSRGANGVILITTKKGKAGPGTLTAKAYTGASVSTQNIQLLNTQQYLEMRKEAFANDGLTPTATSAPDLLTWSQTAYTDWNKVYREGTAHTSNAQLDYAGGDSLTTYRIGFNYHHESPLNAEVASKYAGHDLAYDKRNLQTSLSHHSKNKRFSFTINSSLNYDKSAYTGLIGIITLPPNAPNPIDANGKLVWSANGASYNNPLAPLYNTYGGENKTTVNSLNLSYKILPGLDFQVTGGVNYNLYSEVNNHPAIATNPLYNQKSYSNFQTTNVSSWEAEPMLHYMRNLNSKSKIDVLGGVSWDSKTINSLATNVLGYTNDSFLGTMTGGSTYQLYPNQSEYNYMGYFGRLNYTYDGKYIVNITGRRDGSSRFGPDRKWGTFGAAGAAWVFSDESFVRDHVDFLSFGKLRANYGVTGNDNIGDYKYVDTWTTSNSFAYANSAYGFLPLSLYNPDYSWEKDKKFEAAVDFGFFRDALMVSVDYYLSRAGNQLVYYQLPSQTGFTGVLQNFPAVVQNDGWEFTASATPFKKGKLKWRIDANATIAHNKLASFPGLATSTYANTYQIGQPITAKPEYQYTGLNTQTGVYTYATLDKQTAFVNYNVPTFYGGLTSTIDYKGFTLTMFFQYDKLLQPSYVDRAISVIPGGLSNQPVQILDRWQRPGDNATYMRFSTGRNSQIAQAYYPLTQSSAFFTNASFLRFKNLSLSYTFKPEFLQHAGIKSLQIFFEGQNIATFTPYKGADPESAGMGNPLLKTYTGGLQFSF